MVALVAFATLGIGVLVATADLTATDYLVMPSRSGLACYEAIPSCPPVPSGSLRVFEPNWANSIALAAVVTLSATVLAPRPSHRTDPWVRFRTVTRGRIEASVRRHTRPWRW